jgi:hypothetical protein
MLCARGILFFKVLQEKPALEAAVLAPEPVSGRSFRAGFWREKPCGGCGTGNSRPKLEQNQNKRALTKSLKGGFFLRKKPLGSNAFGVQLF